MSGLRSSSLCRSIAANALPASCGEGSMMLTMLHAGMSLGVTFRHVCPSSWVTWISPSSVPAHSSPCCHGDVVLDAGDVERDRSARGPLLALVVAGEIGADAPPAASLIGALQHELRRRVQNFRIVQRDEHRLGPLYAVLEIFRPVTGYVGGMYREAG